MDSYRVRVSEESRQRTIKKLDSLRYNPRHHMRRVVPVGDRSSIDGNVPNPWEVSRSMADRRTLAIAFGSPRASP